MSNRHDNFDILNNILKSKKINLKETSQTSDKKSRKITENTSKSNRKQTATELSNNEIQDLIENGIRETQKNIIRESSAPDDKKLRMNEAIEQYDISEQDFESFMVETVEPIMETVGTLNESRIFQSSNAKLKGIFLPAYEVALTLEAARLGALDAESLINVPVKESVDPTILDLKAANADENSKAGEVDEDREQSLNDLIDDTVDDTYNMGELEEAANDINDVHQYRHNTDQNVDQSEFKKDEVDFDSDSDIEDYEGETAGDPDSDIDPTDTMPVKESSRILARRLFSIAENLDENETNDNEQDDWEDESDIEEYAGETAGEPTTKKEDQFEGAGTTDEAIIESQIIIARSLIANIFNEYGIQDSSVKKAIVREAIRSIFKYGATNLYPAVSDVATLVTEQNNIASINTKLYNSCDIVANTRAELSESQILEMNKMSDKMLTALAAAKERDGKNHGSPDDGKGVQYKGVGKFSAGKLAENTEYGKVLKAVNHITKAALIERTRQAFRYRMNKYNTDVKSKVSSHWVFESTNLSEAADSVRDYINTREFITNAVNLKEFNNVLADESPIHFTEMKKVVLQNDYLTSAAILNEMGVIWNLLKEDYYNGAPLAEKYLVLDNMIGLTESYKSLVSTVRKTAIAESVIESFSYRLRSLRDRIHNKLNS